MAAFLRSRRVTCHPASAPPLLAQREKMGMTVKIDNATMLAYLRGELDDPVTLQWLDQMMVATDDARAAVGIEPDGARRLLTERAVALRVSMWGRLLHDSAGNECEHLRGRELQPTAITPDHRRLCLDCAADYTWPAMPEEVECPGCGRRDTLAPEEDPTGAVWASLYQFWHFLALLMLCLDCENTLDHSRMDLPPEIRTKLRGEV